MKSPLHILQLEDDPNDALLVRTTLENEGIDCVATRVQTRDDFVAALDRGGIDLVLSDFTLPAFDGLSALKIALDKQPELPVIFVSGTLGEERAIDSLKKGATDYILKERLARLVPAVRRAMQEVEERAERQRLEAQFIEAQKMEVVGQLVGGVTHDFNNVLVVIMGYTDLIAQDLIAGDPLLRYTEEIQLAAKRAAGLTQQLLIFSRKRTVQPVVLDLNEVVEGMDKMLLRLIDENIDMTMIYGQEIGQVNADSGYIWQVLMNLVVNARDAMPKGGELVIETCAVTLDEGYAQAHPGATPGDYVMLSVSDTGVGMTEAVRARLFEAFFTTKPAGAGTGLGLVTCQTIVRQLGGHIQVSSQLGKGTTFRVYFPRIEQPALVAAGSVHKAVPLRRGTETLLIVEDEPSVRRLTQEMLMAQGYQVLTAQNGLDALRVARQHKGQPIALVVSDVIMPRMDGRLMAERLKITYPGLKILFTSGYTDDAVRHHGVLDQGIEFLPKPFTSGALACKVRNLLDAPQTWGPTLTM